MARPKSKEAKELAPGVPLPRYTLPDVIALQALARGDAEPEQQKRALEWIINEACGTYTWAFKQQPRETEVALGRQLVGQTIVGLLKLDLATLRREQNA